MIEDFIRENPDFENNRLATYAICEELERKALSHSRYDIVPDSFTKRRPNETEAAHQYALENYRRITHELIENWLTKTGRIFSSSSFYITDASEDLRLRVSTDKDLFRVNNMSHTWKSYVRHFIYPASLTNPNQIFHFFPVNWELPQEPPYETLPETQDIGLLPMLVNYSKVKFANINLFIFEHETEKVRVRLKNKDREVILPIHYAMDEKFWYQIYPVADHDAKKGYRHEARKWYTHDFDEVPYIWLSGKYQKDKTGNIYLKSPLSSAFEHLDEFVGLFKDSQAVTTQHAYPHMYMADIDCPDCDGLGTIADTGDRCMSCNGMGVMKKPDPTQVLRIPRTNKLVDGDMIDPVMGWLYPGVDIMQHLDEKTKQTFRNAFLSVGLRPFVDVSESGEAKKHRLEDMMDRMEDGADMVKNFSEAMLTMLEMYIQYGKNNREINEVSVNKPKVYHAFNKNEISELSQTANGELKKDLFKYSFLDTYGNNNTNLLIAEVLFLYAPLVASDIDEISSFVNLGVYDNQDVIRANHAIAALLEVSKDDTFASWDYNRIMTEADIKLNEWGLLSPSLQAATPTDG